MIDQKLLDAILDEHKFPCENMSKEERNYYLNILRNCKDICDSNYKVNGIGKCDILQMRLVKCGNSILVEGLTTILTEKRDINGLISISDDSITVEMQIMRFLEEGHEVYSTIDEFSIQNGKLLRKSEYDYDSNNIVEEINNEEMKGKLK